MEKAEIKRISEFLKDLEEGLYEGDYSGVFARRKLDELYPIIKTLMDETFKAKDGLKTFIKLTLGALTGHIATEGLPL